MRIGLLIFALLCLWLRLAMGQPALPKMTRQVLWVHRAPLTLSGYQLIWGTNVLNIIGGSNTSATLTLAEGVNTIVIRAAGTNGIYSDPASNVVRLINYEFQESLNGGTSWATLTNFTYAISNYKTAALYRAKLNWVKP